MVCPLLKTILQFFIRFNVYLLYDAVIPLLGIYTREMKIYLHKKFCSRMLIATLFITGNNPNVCQQENE